MINYYEILEVSEKASKEVIEKAYKALAKKYHPDLNRDNPKEAEQKMKQLNEAFEILMDDSKRANFDNILEKKRALEHRKDMNSSSSSNSTSRAGNSSNFYNNIENANKIAYSKNGYYTDGKDNFYVNTYNMDEKTKKKLQNKLQEKYLEAYDAYLREHGYKLKYKWTLKRFLKLALSVLVFIIVLVILFFIPPIHRYFVNLYNENIVIQVIVNLFKSFFSAIFSIFQ